MTITSDRSTRSRTTRRWALTAAALVATTAVLAAAQPGDTPTGDPELSALVDGFETVTPFRGTDNDGLPTNLDGVFTLGGVTLDAGSSSHPAVARDGHRRATGWSPPPTAIGAIVSASSWTIRRSNGSRSRWACRRVPW